MLRTSDLPVLDLRLVEPVRSAMSLASVTRARLEGEPARRQSGPDPAPGLLARGAHLILVVDDDLGIRTTLAALLEDEGYRVATARHGEEALVSIALERPSLVLLDMRMPVMDGWTLARELRLRATEVPLVVMTAAAQEARRWAEEISATAYLPKPLDPSVLLATLDDICARS